MADLINIDINEQVFELRFDPGNAGGGGVAIQGSGSSVQAAGLVQFSNSNAITFGLNAGTMTASYSHDPYANSTHIHGGAISTVGIAGSVLTNASGSGGLTLGMPAWLTTAAAGSVNFSAGSTSNNLQSISFANGSGVSFGLDAGTLTASVAHPAQSQMPSIVSFNGTSGSITMNFGTFLSASQDGVSWTLSVKDTSAITSAAFPSVNTTKFAGAGTSSTTTGGVDLKFTHDSLGLSYAQPAYITTYAVQSVEPRVVSLNGSSGSMSLNVGSSLSASTDGSTIIFGMASNISTALAPSGHTHSNLYAATSFSSSSTSGSDIKGSANSNGISLWVPPYITTQSTFLKEVQATNGTLNVGTLYFVDSTNIRISADGASLKFSVADFIGLGSSTRSVGLNTSTSSTGGVNLAMSLNSSGATFSVPAWITTYAAQSAEPRVISINGTSGSLSLNAGTFMSLSQNGLSFTYYMTDTSAITSAAFPSANSTKFGSVFSLSNFVHPEDGFADLGLVVQGALSIKRVLVPFNVTATAFKIAVSLSGSTNTSATTASANISLQYGIYSLNGSTLSRSTSGSAANGFVWSHSASTTGNTSIDGMRQMTGSMNVSLVPGYYWFAAVISSATTYTNAGITIHGGPNFEQDATGMNLAPIGSGTTASSMVIPFMGMYTAATSACPASIGKAAIDWTSASAVARANFYNAIYASTY